MIRDSPRAGRSRYLERKVAGQGIWYRGTLYRIAPLVSAPGQRVGSYHRALSWHPSSLGARTRVCQPEEGGPLMAVEVSTMRAPRDTDPGKVAPSLDVGPVAIHRAVGVAISYGESFAVHTRGRAPAFLDVTDAACAVVRRSGVRQGQLLAVTAHTRPHRPANRPLGAARPGRRPAPLCRRRRGLPSQ